MDKQRKGTSTRKPPTPSAGHAEIDGWMQQIMPGLQPLVARLDALIRAELPEAHYAVKWKKAYYGLPERGWLIELVAYDVSVNAVFLGGAGFDSPPPMGEGDRSRYVKLRSLDEIDEPQLRAWIQNAARVDGWT